MVQSRPVIRFIADEHIPINVIGLLRQRGHEVRLSRDELGLKAPDPDIASWAHANHAIILTADKWFRQAIQRSPRGKLTRYNQAGRILFSHGLKEPEMASRMLVHIERIEREYEYQQAQRDKRLIAEITPHKFTVES